MFLTCGGPCRAPEIAILTYVVHADGNRNLAFINQHVNMILRYVKSRAIKGVDDVIPKVVCQAVSKLAVTFIALVLPTVDLLCPVHFGLEECSTPQNLYRNHLFVRSGRLLKSADVYNIIEDFTKEHCGVEINVSSWRHFIKVIYLHFLGKTLDAVTLATEEQDSVTSHIFGHSKKTAQAEYAVLDTSAPTQNLAAFEDQQNMAYAMHRFMNLAPPSEILTSEEGSAVVRFSDKDVTVDALCEV